MTNTILNLNSYKALELNEKANYLVKLMDKDARDIELQSEIVEKGISTIYLTFEHNVKGKVYLEMIDIATEKIRKANSEKFQNEKLDELYQKIYDGTLTAFRSTCNEKDSEGFIVYSGSRLINIIKFEKEGDTATSEGPETVEVKKSESKPERKETKKKERSKGKVISGFKVDQSKSQNEQTKEVLEQLADYARDFTTSEQYTNYLKFIATQYGYSLNNQILLYVQSQERHIPIPYVAGYKQFEKKGITVNKGEKAFWILAPVPFKKEVEQKVKDENGNVVMENGEPKTEKVVKQGMYFKWVPVFSVAQTDYKLPCQPLKGEFENYQEIVDCVIDFAKENGTTVQFTEIEGLANGCFIPKLNHIQIREGMSEQQTLKTLIHEVAHSLLDSDIKVETPTGVKEVRAESVAFAVCYFLGLDTTQYSLGYVSGWAEDKEPTELLENLEVISQTVQKILGAIDKKFHVKQELETQEKDDPTKELKKQNEWWEFENGVVILNKETERIEIYFNEKPSRDVLDEIKFNGGCRYAPSKKCWQKPLNENNIAWAKDYTVIKPVA